jgi:hypothetical protein
MVNGVKVWKCPMCGADCEPTGEVGEDVERRPFFSQLAGAFAYPLRGGGLWMLLVGGVVLTGAQFVATFVWFGLIALVCIMAYVAAFMVKIIRYSASGEPDPPPWPDLGGEELFRPFFLLLAVWLLYSLPGIVAQAVDANPVAVLALYLAGSFFLPMAATVVAMANSFLALNPVLVVRSILKVPLEYLVVIVFLVVVVSLRGVVGNLLEGNILIRLTLGTAVGLYFLMVQMRMLGVMYRANEEKLGWF